MLYAIREKKSGIYICGTDFNDCPPTQRLCDEDGYTTPLLISEFSLDVELKRRQIDKTLYDVCEVKVVDIEKFDYGIVKISHRLDINKPINHEKITLERCIRMGMVHKTKFDSDWWEFQICYKDSKNQLKCSVYKVDDYCISIEHKGDMQISI